MKRILLFTSLLIIGLMPLLGQNLSLTWKEGVIANGSTIDVSGHVDSMIVVYAKVHNNGSSVIEVKVAKFDVFLVPGSMDTYCFAGQCYGGSTPVSPQSVMLNASAADSSFSGDYYPLGNVGVSMIRYLFFNVADPNDSVSVTVRYSGALALEKPTTTLAGISNPYPNPASDRVFFDYTSVNDVHAPRVLIMRDMTGRVVRELNVPHGQGTLEVDLSGIDSGIHFYSFMQGQQVLLTRKLVIKR